MFWRKKNSPVSLTPTVSTQAKLPADGFLVAARTDTDHTTGRGQMAITGRYDSKNDSFGIDAAYAVDDNNTLYGCYGVTDEKLVNLGVETGVNILNRRATIDMKYLPARDSASLKLAVRQGNVKVSAISSFNNLATSNVKNHGEQFELDAVLSGVESLKMSFDAVTKAASVKVCRKLDVKNKLEAEYLYNDAANRFVTLKLKHCYSPVHSFSTLINYGLKKYTVEWDCHTDNGPWTIATSFPFSSSPHSGEWHIKRRFEF